MPSTWDALLVMISKGKGDGGSQSLERGQYSANSDPCGGWGWGDWQGLPLEASQGLPVLGSTVGTVTSVCI